MSPSEASAIAKSVRILTQRSFHAFSGSSPHTLTSTRARTSRGALTCFLFLTAPLIPLRPSSRAATATSSSRRPAARRRWVRAGGRRTSPAAPRRGPGRGHRRDRRSGGAHGRVSGVAERYRTGSAALGPRVVEPESPADERKTWAERGGGRLPVGLRGKQELRGWSGDIPRSRRRSLPESVRGGRRQPAGRSTPDAERSAGAGWTGRGSLAARRTGRTRPRRRPGDAGGGARGRTPGLPRAPRRHRRRRRAPAGHRQRLPPRARGRVAVQAPPVDDGPRRWALRLGAAAAVDAALADGERGAAAALSARPLDGRSSRTVVRLQSALSQWCRSTPS